MKSIIQTAASGRRSPTITAISLGQGDEATASTIASTAALSLSPARRGIAGGRGACKRPRNRSRACTSASTMSGRLAE